MSQINKPNKLGRWLLAALAGLSLLAACNKAPQGQAAPPPPEVDVIRIAPQAVTLSSSLPGRAQAYRTAEVRARVEGIVEKRIFREGSDVKAGAPLYRIDSRVIQMQLASAKADVALARTTLERIQSAFAAAAVSHQDLDQAKVKLKQQQAALAKVTLDLENANVTAPISGHIGRSLVTEGALVGKNEATLLATIEQINPIYINFSEPAADMERLKQAIRSGSGSQANQSRVTLFLSDGRPYEHGGTLLFRNLAVDTTTGSVLLRAEFPNPNHDILPGMFVRIRLPELAMNTAIVVPQRAVQTGGDGQFVTLINEQNKAVIRPIKTGSMVGTDWLVTSGLQGGELVVVNGLQKARPGSQVKANIMPPNNPQPAATAPASPAAPAGSGSGSSSGS